jgi:hypothetical protein
MTMIEVTPTEVQVRCGWLDGRPRSIVMDGEEVPIVLIHQVRDESAAFPIERGPRTIFDVRTPDTRVRLVFQHRRRRWMVEALDRRIETGERLPRAA